MSLQRVVDALVRTLGVEPSTTCMACGGRTLTIADRCLSAFPAAFETVQLCLGCGERVERWQVWEPLY